jgi:N,N'-diacetylchitobiose transport system permease protein
VSATSAAAHRARTRRRTRQKRLARRIGWNVVGLLVAIIFLFPVYWMVSTAFKPGLEIFSLTPHWWPHNPTLSNFRDAIDRPFFWDDVRNSVVITGSVVLLSSVLALLAAVALAKFSFRGRKAIILLVIIVQMFPLVALVIPIYLLLARFHQVNTLPGVIATYLVFVLPFCVWTLRGFVLGVPKELEEAAQVDGATRVGAFLRILLPLVAPGLVATSVFAFIQAWNEYLLAYVLLQDQRKQTLTVWLGNFTTQKGTEWGPLMAGATLTALPVVIFFVIVQRRIAAGITAGAVRG